MQPSIPQAWHAHCLPGARSASPDKPAAGVERVPDLALPVLVVHNHSEAASAAEQDAAILLAGLVDLRRQGSRRARE